MYGDLGKSDYLFLGQGFERGSDKKLFFKGPEVGGIQKIKIKLEGSQPYRCNEITIYIGPKSYNFECLKGLIPCTKEDPDNIQCMLESEADGTFPYEVTVKTSDDKESGTNSPILMNLLGKKGISQPKLLSGSGFKKGKTKMKKMFIKDIGEITGFKLTLTDTGKWKPALIIIKNLVTKKFKKFEIPDTIIINPGKSTFILDTNSKKSKSPQPVSRTLELDNPDGGLLSYEDFKSIIDLKCDQKLYNPTPSKLLFGPDYPTSKVNYMSVLARCPSNCHLTSEDVYGLSIHPDASPICLSALVDNAISYYGGIISISILAGLNNYPVPKGTGLKNGIKVISYSSHAKKSYTVSRVDNIDLVEKDLRILDSFGKLSNEGRVEFRGEGEWGTICSMGNNKLAAQRICKDLGFKNGEWKSPSDQRSMNFCKTFKSRNHCGAKNQLIHFYNVKCSELDSNFDSCNKQLIDPSICTHNFDAIIHCFNENYEVEKTIPEGTIKLNSYRKDGHITIGRLEMFSKEQFLPICNLGFNQNAAKIACKQMGFDSGKLLKSIKKIKNFQLDSESEMPFSADNVSCTGTETKLTECSMNLSNVSCKHDMDVVIKCMNGEGDVSGKSQYVTPVLNNPPSLGKLGLPKIILTCSDKGNNENFRGDPGSIYIIECPANCGSQEGTIWGTGIYTSNSNVCKAAIHAGVIGNNSGGKFVLSRSYGQNFYYGSNNNDIISTVYFGRWPASITFSKMNSGYENLNNIVFGSSFLESSSLVVLSDRFNSHLQPFSFLETEANLSIPTPVFEWLPEDYTYKFSENSNILLKKHKLESIKSFSLIIKFKMNDFKNTPSYIFSYPGCNGLNVMLDEEDNLIIGDICNSLKRVKPGFAVPMDDKILLFVKYNSGKLYVRIFSTKTKNLIEKSYIDKFFEFNNPGNIGIGRMGTDNKGFFYGSIDFIQIYDLELPNYLFDAIINNIKSPTRLGANPSEKTLDNRPCVSPCTTNPIPGKKGSGIPPPEASLYGIRKKSSFTEKNKKFKASNFGTYDMNQASSLESIDIDCDVNLNDKRFLGSVGMIFRVNCKSCDLSRGVVFGTAIYHPLSSICKAAFHSGALIKGKPGNVLLQLGQKQPAFNGSEGQDGSNSATFSGAKKSFMVRKAPKLTRIGCKTKGDNIMFSQKPLYTRFVVLCPKNCLRFKGNVFGTGTYSENSSICKAAIHFGMVGNKGGEIQFVVVNGQQNYKGSKGFGIVSKSKASHIRSFKFVGHKAAITFNFKENYQGILGNRWKIDNQIDALNSLSNSWNFVNDKKVKIEGKNIKIKGIYHNGFISSPKENEFGTVISLKNAEWANSVIRFNMLLLDTKPIATLIRFNDLQNYYAIEFNTSGNNNIKLIKKVNGRNIVVLSKPFKLLLKKWYSITINLSYNTIQLKVQSHVVREHKTIFKTEVSGISRGTLGFGSNGNNKFYINGIQISEFKPNGMRKFKGNKRSWNRILKKVSKKDRIIYCRNVFNFITSEIQRCVEVRNYCQIRCDQTIPSVENILNYSCSRDCLRTANLKEGKKEKITELTRLIKQSGWKPRKNEKCDYRPEGENNYRLCVVRKVRRKGNKKIVYIKYMKNPWKYTKAKVEYPSERLKKCGMELTTRNDCNIKNN